MFKGRRFGGVGVAVATLVAGVAVFAPTPAAQAQTVGVQARPADALVDSIGVNTHLHYSGSAYKELANVERVLVDAGIRHIRDYPVNVAAIAQLAQRGVRTSAIIGHPDQGSWGLPIDTYFGNIKKAPEAFASIEGTNEPDITMGSDWASKMRTHQKAVWDRVKGDPTLRHLPVAGPALTWAKNASALGDISASADWGNMHPYPGGRTPDKRVSEDVAAAKQHNVAGKPVIATETGYHTALQSSSGHRAATEAAQGTYMPRLSLGYFAMGVPRTFSYELVDQGADQTNSEKSFGLVRRDFTPKPAYTATKNMVALLADPGPAFTPGRLAYALGGTDTATRQVVLQKRDGSFWLAVWQETSVWDEVNKQTINPPDRALTLDLETVSDVRTYMPNAATAPRATLDDTTKVSFTSSEQVTLLEIRATTAPAPTTTEPAPAPTTTTAPAPTTAPVQQGGGRGDVAPGQLRKLVSAASACPDEVPGGTFPDVAAANVHNAAIDCLAWWDIARGRNGSYLPDNTVTREQMASLLVRSIEESGGSLPAAPTVTFGDVAMSSHRTAIELLATAGIATGRPDGTFGPGEPMTRAQMTALVVRTYGHLTRIQLEVTVDHFTDDETSVHEELINGAAEIGIVSGVGSGRFEPESPVRRDHAASMLVRVLALLVEGGQSRLPA